MGSMRSTEKGPSLLLKSAPNLPFLCQKADETFLTAVLSLQVLAGAHFVIHLKEQDMPLNEEW